MPVPIRAQNEALPGFTCGISQSYRSPSVIGSYYIYDDDPWYDVEMDEEFNTDGFIRYETHFGNGKSRTDIGIVYRVNNLFDTSKLMNRNRSAFYPEPIRHSLEVSINF